MPSAQDLAGLMEEVTKVAVELRRRLHQHPEPSHQEHETTSLIAATLNDYRVDYNLRTPEPGLWVDIGGDPKVGFRADLDALPIHEPEDNAPRSRNDGYMHACGHDAHAAIATGIALAMSRIEPSDGVRIIFQPAEESLPSGAAQLVAEGLVDGLKGLLAFHVDPSLEVGKVGARVGAITGSADGFKITLHGPGGHTARPDRTIDLVHAAGRVVTDLPDLVRRTIDSRVPLTVVFGSIHGGEAPNVIPTEVVLRGTVRTLSTSTWETLPTVLEGCLSPLTAVAGADYTLEYFRGIPPVVNDREIIEAATEHIIDSMGSQAVVGTETSMGGEDFANYLSIVPGALLRLGTFSGGGDLHSASFKINEASIGFGIRTGVAALTGLMNRF